MKYVKKKKRLALLWPKLLPKLLTHLNSNLPLGFRFFSLLVLWSKLSLHFSLFWLIAVKEAVWKKKLMVKNDWPSRLYNKSASLHAARRQTVLCCLYLPVAFTGSWAPAVRCHCSSASSSRLALITLDRVQQLCDVLLSGLIHLDHSTLDNDNNKKKKTFQPCFNPQSHCSRTAAEITSSLRWFCFDLKACLDKDKRNSKGDANTFIGEVSVPAVKSRNAHFQSCVFDHILTDWTQKLNYYLTAVLVSAQTWFMQH